MRHLVIGALIGAVLGAYVEWQYTRLEIQSDSLKMVRTIGSEAFADEVTLTTEAEKELTRILFPSKSSHLNTALNKLACDYVNGLNLGRGGCYDECIVRASYEENGKYINPDGLTDMFDGKTWIHTPLSLSEQYSHELQNACAIVMHGGEY